MVTCEEGDTSYIPHVFLQKDLFLQMADSGQCLRLLVFEEELDFIESHNICDDDTERALRHSLQTCVEISMGIVAMLTKGAGLVVEMIIPT